MLGTTDFTWYRKQMVQGTELWNEMQRMFSDFCDGKDFVIADAYAIYNPALVSSFIAQLYVLSIFRALLNLEQEHH